MIKFPDALMKTATCIVLLKANDKEAKLQRDPRCLSLFTSGQRIRQQCTCLQPTVTFALLQLS
jgi:hypothetical protein